MPIDGTDGFELGIVTGSVRGGSHLGRNVDKAERHRNEPQEPC
jgi:hypothetical protein